MGKQLGTENHKLLNGGRIGTLLVNDGLVTESQLEEALALQRIDEPFIIDSLVGQILVAKGYVDEEQVAKTYAEQIGIPFLDVDMDRLDPEITRYLHSYYLYNHSCAPLYTEDKTLVVGTPFGDNLRMHKLFPLHLVLEGCTNFFSLEDYRVNIITESAFYQALEEGNLGEHKFNTQSQPYLTQRRMEMKNVAAEELFRKEVEEGTVHVYMSGMYAEVGGRKTYLGSDEVSALANMWIQRNALARKEGMREVPKLELIK
ncbi:hypothetical protein HOE07_04160 [archaeon]|jgi:hypothetical protein|nr:hypothetical protein [archaeon]